MSKILRKGTALAAAVGCSLITSGAFADSFTLADSTTTQVTSGTPDVGSLTLPSGFSTVTSFSISFELSRHDNSGSSSDPDAIIYLGTEPYLVLNGGTVPEHGGGSVTYTFDSASPNGASPYADTAAIYTQLIADLNGNGGVLHFEVEENTGNFDVDDVQDVTLTVDTDPSVPDGGATAGLLGLAFTGLASIRRKMK